MLDSIPNSVDDLPVWNYDGSSTGQADAHVVVAIGSASLVDPSWALLSGNGTVLREWEFASQTPPVVDWDHSLLVFGTDNGPVQAWQVRPEGVRRRVRGQSGAPMSVSSVHVAYKYRLVGSLRALS